MDEWLDTPWILSCLDLSKKLYYSFEYVINLIQITSITLTGIILKLLILITQVISKFVCAQSYGFYP